MLCGEDEDEAPAQAVGDMTLRRHAARARGTRGEQVHREHTSVRPKQPHSRPEPLRLAAPAR